MSGSEADRNNNFDFLRILAASMVVVGHAYPLKGNIASIPGLAFFPVHELAVIIFFSISGFLVTKSLLFSPNLLSFARKRLLRILPALIFVVLSSSLVLGPVVSNMGVAAYFGNEGWFRYFANILFYPVYSLPGVFGNLPYPNAVNGSLWTLPVEVACYVLIAVGLAGFSRIPRIGVFIITVALGVTGIFLHSSELRVVFYGSELGSSSAIAAYFFSGSLVYLFTRNDSSLLRLDLAIMLLIALIFLAQVSTVFAQVFAIFAVPYLIISFGVSRTPIVMRFGRFGDPSYGLYLWAWPVQQTILSTRLAELPFEVNILLVLAISAALGFASWHVIEKPFMRMVTTRHSSEQIKDEIGEV